MKLLAIITVSVFILLTISSCVFHAYPTRIFRVEMDRAIGWNGKILIKTFEGKIKVFDAITKDNEGNYFGLRKRKGEQQSVALNLESIKEIRLEDKNKSERKNRLIFGGIGFVAVVVTLAKIVIWVLSIPAG